MAESRYAKKGKKPAAQSNWKDVQTTHVEVPATVKWFNPSKGFGFVTCDGINGDIFLHAVILERKGIKPDSMQEMRSVRVSYGQGPKGLCATDVFV